MQRLSRILSNNLPHVPYRYEQYEILKKQCIDLLVIYRVTIETNDNNYLKKTFEINKEFNIIINRIECLIEMCNENKIY
jgi:hypothetical protein